MNMENQENTPNNGVPTPHPEGINEWNDRLDENLESEQTGNLDADEKARDYSAKHGSGDQSDESLVEKDNPKTS